MPTAQVRHRGGQARPDDMGADLRGNLAATDAATAGAGSCVPLVLGDDGSQYGEFGDLMPSRFGVARSRLERQGSVTVVADRRYIRHDLVDPLTRQTMAVMSLVPRLTARLAPAWRLGWWLGRAQRIRRWGDRGVGRILIESFLEVADRAFELRDQRLKRGDPLEKLEALGTRRCGRRQSIAHGEQRYKSAPYSGKSTRAAVPRKIRDRRRGVEGPSKQKRCRSGD